VASEFVRAYGPLFDGRAEASIPVLLTEIDADVAQVAVNSVLAWLGGHLQNPTGYYESQIATDMAVTGASVNDSGVIYGPWLEGTGSRNYPRTRFKGYHTFRSVTQDLEQHLAGPVAERHVAAWTVKNG
jgi:hypothetical protein